MRKSVLMVPGLMNFAKYSYTVFIGESLIKIFAEGADNEFSITKFICLGTNENLRKIKRGMLLTKYIFETDNGPILVQTDNATANCIDSALEYQKLKERSFQE